MKAVVSAPLMISLALLLCACGSPGTEERIEARREALAAAETLTFTAELSADLENNEIFQFSLACREGDGILTAEILAPASIAGLRARMDGNGTALVFENVSLGLGDGAGYPLAFLPILTEALRSGHIIRSWAEHGHLAAELYVGDGKELTVWYEENTMNPAFASLSENGVERVRCRMTDFHTE